MLVTETGTTEIQMHKIIKQGSIEGYALQQQHGQLNKESAHNVGHRNRHNRIQMHKTIK